MAERKAGNWLRGFEFYTKESEAPDSFILWAGLSAIAGATQRQVYINWAYRKWYTNMYLMLVGPSGSRKSTALFFSKDLIRAVGVPISSDVLSKEAMIEQMVERNKMKKPPRSALTISVSEFMTFFQVSGLPMIEFLTDVWDSQDKWEYATKKRGTEIVNNIFLNMQGATTPSWIAETFTSAFVEHGFVGRTIFVAEEEKRFYKARPQVSQEMKQMYVNLLEDLSHIATIKGEFQWSKEAEEYFDHYYEKEYPKEEIDYRLQSYLERKPTHILKTAMILALSQSDELVLREKHLAMSRALLEQLEPKMVKAFSAVGRNIHAQDLVRMVSDISKNGGMTEEELRKRNMHAMDKQRLDQEIENMLAMGLIKMTIVGGKRAYKTTGKAL